MNVKNRYLSSAQARESVLYLRFRHGRLAPPSSPLVPREGARRAFLFSCALQIMREGAREMGVTNRTAWSAGAGKKEEGARRAAHTKRGDDDEENGRLSLSLALSLGRFFSLNIFAFGTTPRSVSERGARRVEHPESPVRSPVNETKTLDRRRASSGCDARAGATSVRSFESLFSPAAAMRTRRCERSGRVTAAGASRNPRSRARLLSTPFRIDRAPIQNARTTGTKSRAPPASAMSGSGASLPCSRPEKKGLEIAGKNTREKSLKRDPSESAHKHLARRGEKKAGRTDGAGKAKGENARSWKR